MIFDGRVHGHAVKALQIGPDGWQILVGSRGRNVETYYTFDIKAHHIEHKARHQECPLTKISGNDLEALQGLSEALADMGIMPRTIVEASKAAELKATKIHLEDMRKLTFTKGDISARETRIR